ncbi:MAG: MBL fold metallo-hydrolase [Rhodanobacteraceae bacterium]|nr:MBL fold metallo-hydrolase [Rhodanobacteraceae bacterium]
MRLALSYLFAAALTLLGAAHTTDAAAGFRLETLAPGVHAAIRTDPPGLMVDANCLFIVNDDDVVVVDAPEASTELIAALRQVTDKPVRYLINTHWHDDHVIGNALWRKAWPDIQFIAHPSLRDYLPGTGAENRRDMITGAPQAAEEMQEQLAAGKNLAGKPISDEERASYASDIALVAHYMKVVPGTPDVLPDLSTTGNLILQRGSRRIEVRRLGRGHTDADLAVWLPQERILASGDLVVWPVPLVGGEQSHVNDWPAALDALLALKPALIVPGHGPVQRDTVYVELLRDLFTDITRQVRELRGRGLDLDGARKAIKLDDWHRRLAGDSAVRDALFRMYVAAPALVSAWNATAQ